MSKYIFKLTPRELEIAQLIAKGFTNKMICEKLCISKHTLPHFLTHIFQKLNLNNIDYDRGTMRVKIALFILNNNFECENCEYIKRIMKLNEKLKQINRISEVEDEIYGK